MSLRNERTKHESQPFSFETDNKDNRVEPEPFNRKRHHRETIIVSTTTEKIWFFATASQGRKRFLITLKSSGE
jgi:hypothetical protein